MSGANPANFSAGQQIANPTYLVDSSGNQITSFGGGTQYTTGAATPGSPIGTLPVFDNSGTIAKVSVSVGLPVNVVQGTISAENPSVGVLAAAIPADATLLGASDGTNLQQLLTESASARNLRIAIFNAGNEATVDSGGRLSNFLVDSAGTNVAGVDSSHNVLVKVNAALPAGTNVIGSTTIQATSGTALQADQGNTILKTSLYVKTSAAADTVLALGQAAMAASVPVTMANNQTAMPVGLAAGTAFDGNAGTISANTLRTIAGGAATGTKSSVAGSASSVTILAANTSRKGAMIYNDGTAVLYLDLSGGTATSSSYSVQIPANGFFELPGPNIYNGLITGIWASATGNARVTEFS